MSDHDRSRTHLSRTAHLTRRAALTCAGGAGVGALLAVPVLRVAAQGATPATADLPPVVAEYVAAWEAGDLDQFAATLTEDVVFDEVAFDTAIEGRDNVIAYFRAFVAAFSDHVADYTNAFASGSFAAAEWEVSGRYTGHLEGLPPGEGQPFAVRGVDVLQLEGDRIRHISEYGNAFGLLTQLGFLPGTEGEAAEATPAG